MSLEEPLAYANARLHHANGELAFHLELFGEELARREGYKVHSGIDAVHFYLTTKHGWLPRDVKAMSFEDLRFTLAEEMSGWTLPIHTRGLYPGSSK